MKILQSWDDGVVEDIRIVEILNRYSATASFNLNIQLYERERSYGWDYKDKQVWRLGIDEMVDIYDGFEIASHTLNHVNLCDLDSDEVYNEVFESRRLLQELFEQPVKGFAYPFGRYNDAAKNVLREAGYSYARTVENTLDAGMPPDPMEFRPHCHFLDDEFWDIFDKLKAENAPFFFFWGHSYEIMDFTMWREFEEMISRLDEDPETEWADLSSLFE